MVLVSESECDVDAHAWEYYQRNCIYMVLDSDVEYDKDSHGWQHDRRNCRYRIVLQSWTSCVVCLPSKPKELRNLVTSIRESLKVDIVVKWLGQPYNFNRKGERRSLVSQKNEHPDFPSLRKKTATGTQLTQLNEVGNPVWYMPSCTTYLCRSLGSNFYNRFCSTDC